MELSFLPLYSSAVLKELYNTYKVSTTLVLVVIVSCRSPTSQGALVDSLQDGCDSEEGEGHVIIPVVNGLRPHAAAVQGEILLCCGDAQLRQVTPTETSRREADLLQ